MKNKQPARLEKVEEETILEFLNKDLMFKIKFYVLVIITMIIMIIICFIIQPQTYGFLNW